MNLLLLYFKRVQVNYAEFMAAPPVERMTPDQMWTEWAADIHRYLERILSFAQPAGYDERLAHQQRYEAEGAEDLRRQLAEWEAR